MISELGERQRPIQEIDEISLVEIWSAIWSERLLVVLIVGFFAVASVIYSLSLTNIFSAVTLLAPATNESSSRVGNQLGLAASFIGVNLASSDSGVTNAIATLKSREFITQFLISRNVLPWLVASEYDSSRAESIMDEAVYDTASNSWVESYGGSSEPSAWQAFNIFSNILNVSEERDTGLIHVSIQWPDPALAAKWVNWLIEDVNGHIKAKDMREARQAIEYLQEQLESTQLVEMQRVFYQLIESQTRILMLADVREGYVFEIIDPAVTPEERIYPQRSRICILATLLGGFIALLVVFIKSSLSRWRKAVA